MKKQSRTVDRAMNRAPRFEVVVCRGPECGDKRGSGKLEEALVKLCRDKNIADRVHVDRQTCFGYCLTGPNILVREADTKRNPFGTAMPGASGDAVLYHQVTDADLPRIVDEHLLAGRPVRALLGRGPKSFAQTKKK